MSSASAPRVIAHRGASATHPENTAAAFAAALAQGADGIELDVQLSRDAVPWVYHDRTLTKADGSRRRLDGRTAAELATLRIGGEPLVDLESVLVDYARRTRLLLELKPPVRRPATDEPHKTDPPDAEVSLDDDPAEIDHRVDHEPLVTACAALLERHRLAGAVSILCFHLGTLRAVHDRLPTTDLVLNVLHPPGPAELRALPRFVSTVSVDVRALEPQGAHAIHASGRQVLAWTCNHPGTVALALRCGVDGIMTDRPGWLREWLRADGAPPRTTS